MSVEGNIFGCRHFSFIFFSVVIQIRSGNVYTVLSFVVSSHALASNSPFRGKLGGWRGGGKEMGVQTRALLRDRVANLRRRKLRVAHFPPELPNERRRAPRSPIPSHRARGPNCGAERTRGAATRSGAPEKVNKARNGRARTEQRERGRGNGPRWAPSERKRERAAGRGGGAAQGPGLAGFCRRPPRRAGPRRGAPGLLRTRPRAGARPGPGGTEPGGSPSGGSARGAPSAGSAGREPPSGRGRG